MAGLSPSSHAFLREVRRNSGIQNNQESYGQAYTQLFCELYDIMRDVKASLDQQEVGSWVLTYQGTEMEKTMSFAFRLKQELGSHDIMLHYTIDPFGVSSLSVKSGLSESIKNDPVIAAFYRSSSYKRYFASNKREGFDLYTEVPKRQILSRHFSDYLVHLTMMAVPYIKLIKGTTDKSRLIAA